MPKPGVTKQEFARFGRLLALLLNRTTMYQLDHPYVRQSLDEFYPVVDKLLGSVNPLVFAMNRDQFFVDEEPLDPRINTSKIGAHFKKAGIESVSFVEGLGQNELRTFLDILVSLNRYPNADAMREALTNKAVFHVKINHVFYRKVTEDDEVVSREALGKLTPDITDEAQLRSKKLIIDMVLESVLAEELEKTLTLNNLVSNPTGLSRNMIELDIKSSKEHDDEEHGPGPVLLHQLQIIGQEVEKCLSGEVDLDLSELASAVFDMKKQLIEGIGAQKGANLTYSNEEEIVDTANEIADNVLVELVKSEYKAGNISALRLAQILRRLIPNVDELKRVLPKIKKALVEAGMPISEYMHLVKQLDSELQSDELARVFQESSEEVGIDGAQLIEEVKNNPTQAAELICLAAEIRKGTGDEKVLSDLLVDYVERLGSGLAEDIGTEKGEEGEKHVRQVLSGLESNIVRRLREMDVKDDILMRLEETINKRVDNILDKLRSDWIQSQANSPNMEKTTRLSVLQVLEQSVSENDDLGEILKAVRSKAQSGEIDENDFRQIYAEIDKLKQMKEENEAKRNLPPGTLKDQDLKHIIGKELLRAKRYGVPFSVLSFSVVKAIPKTQATSETITKASVIDATLFRLSTTIRESDIIGILDKDTIIVLLPMTTSVQAKTALRRCLKVMHGEPLKIDGIKVTIRVAGVATGFDSDAIPNSDSFLKTMSNELTDMVSRVKNIQALV